VNELYYMMK